MYFVELFPSVLMDVSVDLWGKKINCEKNKMFWKNMNKQKTLFIENINVKDKTTEFQLE